MKVRYIPSKKKLFIGLSNREIKEMPNRSMTGGIFYLDGHTEIRKNLELMTIASVNHSPIFLMPGCLEDRWNTYSIALYKQSYTALIKKGRIKEGFQSLIIHIYNMDKYKFKYLYKTKFMDI
jgi:hypothetical protein